MSNPEPQPSVSVIVGSNGAPGALESCLEALEGQREGAEVVICEADESPASLRERFPWARFVHRPGALVPELWTNGIECARGSVVALTISPMLPADDWIETIRSAHGDSAAMAGAIEPGPGLRMRDWAEYFCRYSREMLPFEPHESVDLPGDNAAYSRESLESVRDTYRDGFWEPEVHRELARQGARLWQSPAMVVRQGRSAGTRAFVDQRLKHGRAYGRQRSARFSRARNAVGALAAPAVPFLMAIRIVGQVRAKRRLRARVLLAMPIILLFNAAWAVGEARGHLDALAGRT